VAASVIVDTGPIVALLDADESHHLWVVDQFERLRPPLITCEAVLSEAAFLMGRTKADPGCVAALVLRGLVTVEKVFDDEATMVRMLMRRYANVPMSLADACLVRLVERTANATLFTLDTDFRIYRQKIRRVIPLVAPW
jgi:predicted nucleic acid-binding protein